MRSFRGRLLIVLGAAGFLWAVSSHAEAQGWRPGQRWGNSQYYNNATGTWIPPAGIPSNICFEWIDFEHAWANQPGFAPSFQVDPVAQPDPLALPKPFNAFGFDRNRNYGWPQRFAQPLDVYNRQANGMGPPNDVLANQNQGGPFYFSYNNSRTATASSGTCSATATASVNMQELWTPPPQSYQYFWLNPSIGGTASAGPGSAYRYANSIARAYTGMWIGGQPVNGQSGITWGWFIAGTAQASGAATMGGGDDGGGDEPFEFGAPPPSARQAMVARIVAPDGTIVLQDTLAEAVSTIDFALTNEVEASIRWEADQLSFTNVGDGEFCVRISGEHVAPEDRGEIDVIKHNGVVTTSRHTGIFNTVAVPPIGSDGDFIISLPQLSQFDSSIPTPPGPDTYTFEFNACVSQAELPAIWGGDGADSNWSTPGNWLYAEIPGDQVSLYFTKPIPGLPPISNNDLSPGKKVSAIIFRPEVDAHYLLQGNSIVLDGLVQNLSPMVQHVHLDVELAEFGATFDAGAGDLIVSGVISGTGSLTKTGPGMLLLSQDGEYTGATKILDGVLELVGDADLASSSQIENDAVFRINGGDHTVGIIKGNGTTNVVAGKLTASSITQDRLVVGFLVLSSVPEPSTLLLLAMAGSLGLLAAWQKKKSRI
jgi:autotransporter-associated beta strand protein